MRRGPNHDVQTVDARVHRDTGVIHVTADMGENLSFEPELANSLTILPRLLRGGGGSQLNVVHAKVVQGFGNFDLSLGVEESVRKLFAFAKSRLDWTGSDIVSSMKTTAKPNWDRILCRHAERNQAVRELRGELGRRTDFESRHIAQGVSHIET